MPERSEYSPGTPSWVDLTSSDVDSSAAFYAAVFGWEHQLAGPVEEAGGYGFFLKDGKMVAGVGPKQNEQQPAVWVTYIASDDAQATAQKVTAAGGQVMLEPFEVMDAGQMGVFVDSTGAVFAVWEAGRHKGAELFGEPGAISWNELYTRDVAAAEAFYASVFGWKGETMQMGPDAEYTMLALGDQQVGGMLDMTGQMPDEVPPHWLVYFGTENADDAVTRISERGGTIATPVMAIPAGRFAVAADPQGSHFGVFEMASDR